ncbi:hypothetical protein B0H67DRAFT_347558 [Lasiosphaeris hirsuta]|uniref:Secreted protein n=1 Tax=Lasiosphaeris hirsuta TaxID=260670 RepID=A0AA40DKN6_9PEZI|nr:hypothetical protein B0H67DRAFT_347558 [Lasiosphaeris hirsuta]
MARAYCIGNGLSTGDKVLLLLLLLCYTRLGDWLLPDDSSAVSTRPTSSGPREPDVPRPGAESLQLPSAPAPRAQRDAGPVPGNMLVPDHTTWPDTACFCRSISRLYRWLVRSRCLCRSRTDDTLATLHVGIVRATHVVNNYTSVNAAMGA